MDEELDEETVTEVEVSEKTLKFKISTEGTATSFRERKTSGNYLGNLLFLLLVFFFCFLKKSCLSFSTPINVHWEWVSLD